jgi:salicylate hydroxylase
MHRADLVELLYRACKRFANIDILFGIRSFDVTSHARGISTIIDDATGVARSARGFAFVGADGVNSQTRQRVFGGPEATFAGSIAWRTTLPMGDLARVLQPDRVTLLMAPGYHAVCYPLPHRRQINVALFTSAKKRAAFGPTAARSPKLPWAALRSRHFDAIMEAAGDTWGLWPVSTVEADTWSSGRVGLIGDAAHAMLPHQAQGAAMAIEDAAVLAPLLVTEADAESALSRFESLRRPRVERVRRLSGRNGFAFHLEWPFTYARDAVIALQGSSGHLRRLRWLYGYGAETRVKAPPSLGRGSSSRGA